MTTPRTDLGLTDLGLTDANDACACGGHACGHHDSRPAEGASDAVRSDAAVRTEYLVEGMTCTHCVASVTEEVSEIAGVEAVDVDLQVGGASRVVVSSSGPLSADDIRAAVEEAGYSLAATR